MEEKIELTYNEIRNLCKEFWEFGQQQDTPVNPYNDESFDKWYTEFINKLTD